MFKQKQHHDLWIWLSEHPEKEKEDWPGWKINGGTEDRQDNYCFACGKAQDCKNCPLVWPMRKDGEAICYDNGGLYEQWWKTGDLTEKSRIAKQIANLPVKTGVEIEEEEHMETIKVGDRVELIDAGGDFSSHAKVGDKGTVTKIGSECINVAFDDGSTTSRFPKRFKLISKEPFTVGTKVLWDDKSYAYELSDGKLIEVKCSGFCGEDDRPYIITDVGQKLPAIGTGRTNNTIIKRISDGAIFFTQSRFLKKYEPKPKFKRGDFVVCNGYYYRISAVDLRGDKYLYVLTQIKEVYSRESFGVEHWEHELKPLD